MDEFTYYADELFLENSKKKEMNSRLFYVLIGLSFLCLFFLAISMGLTPQSQDPMNNPFHLGALITLIISPFIASGLMSCRLPGMLLLQRAYCFGGFLLSIMPYMFLAFYSAELREVFFSLCLIVIFLTTVGIIKPDTFSSFKEALLVVVAGFVFVLVFQTHVYFFVELSLVHWIAVFICSVLIGGVYYQVAEVPKNLNNSMVAVGFFFIWIVSMVMYILYKFFYYLFRALGSGTEMD